MTELRDARLKRALHAAPDASPTAPDTTRHAIRDAAMKAVAPAPDAAWWRRWVPERHSRMPWNAAFATVLLAVLIGVMWRGEELPDARRESAVPPAVAPAPVPPPVAASSVTPAPAPASPPSRAPARAPSAAPEPPVLNDARTRQAPLAKAVPPAVPASASQPAPPPAATETAKATDSLAAGAAASADSLRRDAAPAAEARDYARAPAVAPAPPARMQRAAIAPPAWTELRIETGGRSIMVPRSQAAGLAANVDRLIAGVGTQEELQSQPDVAIELMMDGRRVGWLELAGDQVRVTETGAAQHTGRPGGRVLQQLRDEIARLLAR